MLKDERFVDPRGHRLRNEHESMSGLVQRIFERRDRRVGARPLELGYGSLADPKPPSEIRLCEASPKTRVFEQRR